MFIASRRINFANVTLLFSFNFEHLLKFTVLEVKFGFMPAQTGSRDPHLNYAHPKPFQTRSPKALKTIFAQKPTKAR